MKEIIKKYQLKKSIEVTNHECINHYITISQIINHRSECLKIKVNLKMIRLIFKVHII